nr:ATP synthase F0 subunit 8 [Dolichorhinotermes tenebrosus]
MPQMMPMEWTTLYLFFLTTFLTFNIMNYYIASAMSESLVNKLINQTPLNWKW